jgi:hypothetical protein
MQKIDLEGNYTSISCTEDAAVLRLVQALTGSDSSLPANVSCNGTYWVVATCSDISQVSICNNCDDPCLGVASNYVSDSNDYAIMNFPSTCATQECHHSLIVDFTVPYPAAEIGSVATTIVGTTSATVQVFTDAPATVYCAAMKYTVTPTTIAQVTSIANVNATGIDATGNNSAHISFEHLFPASNYSIYCTTKSMGGTYTTVDSMIDGKTGIYTDCCKGVYVTAESGTIYSGINYADQFKVVLENIPEVETILTFEIMRYASGSSGMLQVDSTVYLNPNTFTFTASSDPDETLYMALLSSSQFSTDYTYTIRMNETKVSRDWYVFQPLEYTMDLVRGDPVLLGSSSLPGAPSIASSEFSVDGTYALVTFDAATDRAGLSARFSCAATIFFDGSDYATCSWLDSSTIKIIPGQASPRLRSGSSLQFYSAVNRVRAYCDDDASTCAQYPYMSTSTVVSMTVPSNAVTPSVVMTNPGTISYCDDLKIDLSSSSGAAGQSWSSVSVSVESSESSVSTVQAVFTSEAAKVVAGTQAYMLVPYSSLSTGTWAISVQICNFLGKCGRGQTTVQVIGSLLPNVQVGGSSILTVNRGDSIDLKASAYVPSCSDDSISRTGISFSWGVYLDNVLQTKISSTSRNPYKLTLDPYTLNSGNTYEMRASAVYDAQGTSSYQVVQVIVEEGDIMAVISGAVSRSIKIGEQIAVDASGSYDLDLPEDSRADDGDLQYEWSCETLKPIPSQMCAVTWANQTKVYDSMNSNTNAYTLAPQPIWYGEPNSYLTSAMVLRVTLKLIKNSRSVTTSVKLKVVPAGSTLVDIESVSTKKDATKRIYLSGTVTSDSASTVVWSVDGDSGLTMDDIAYSRYSSTFSPPNGRTRSKTFSLALRSNILPDDADYTFTLTSTLVSDSSKQSEASVTVTTNGPPTPGTLVVDPVTGFELSTTFLLTMASWVDEDLPLLYEFGFYSVVNGKLVSLGGRSATSYYSALMPAGDSNSSSLTCVGVVLDSYLAKTTATSIVTVSRQNAASARASDLGDTLDDMLSEAGDVPEESKSALAVASNVLNRVNCANITAAMCLSYNREVCSVRDNVCGACMDGYVSGEIKFGNSVCVLESDISRRRLRDMAYPYPMGGEKSEYVQIMLASTSCETNSDCTEDDPWAMCVEEKCIIPSKTCPGDCSEKGKCSYINNNSGYKVAECLVSDPTCTAVCTCTDGYGLSCSLTLEESILRADLRDTMASELELVMAAEDVASSIESWITLLLAITEDVYDLSRTTDGVSRCIALADSIITSADALEGDDRLEVAILQDLLQAIDNVMAAQSTEVRNITAGVTIRPVIPGRILLETDLDRTEKDNRYNYNHRRRLRLERVSRLLSGIADVVVNDTAALSNVFTLLDLTQRYNALLADDMSEGEFAQQTVMNTVRTSVQKFAPSDTDTLYVGASTAEAVSSDTFITRLKVPVLDNNVSTTLSNINVAMTEIPSGLYGNGTLNSNPVRLYLENVDSSLVDSNSTWEFVIANTYAVDTSNYSRVIVQPCYNRRHTYHSHKCPGNFNNVTTQCNGSAYEVTLTCPSFRHQAVCTTLSTTDSSYATVNCTVVDFNATSTTCSCPLSVIIESSTESRRKRRRLDGTWEDGSRRHLLGSVGGSEYTGWEFESDYFDFLPDNHPDKRQLLVTSSYTFDISTVDTVVTKFYDKYEELTKWPDEETPRYRVQYGVCIFIAVFLALLSYGFFADLWMIDVLDDGERVRKANLDLTIWDTKEDEVKKMKEKGNQGKSKVDALRAKVAERELERLREQRRNSEIPPMRNMIRNSIPQIYSRVFFYRRLLVEFMKHHRLFGILTHYDTKMSRFTRTSVLFMHLSIFLFVCVVTALYILYDDGTCARYNNMEQCHRTPGRFDVSISYCEYNVFENTCYLRIPYDNPFSVCFAMAFAYLATTPITIICDWVIQRLIRNDEIADQVEAIKIQLMADDYKLIAIGGRIAVEDALKDVDLSNIKQNASRNMSKKMNSVSPIGGEELMEPETVLVKEGIAGHAMNTFMNFIGKGGSSPNKVTPHTDDDGVPPEASMFASEEEFNAASAAASAKRKLAKMNKAEEKRRAKEAAAEEKRKKEQQENQYSEMFQTRLEEKILGTTLEQDIAKWEDAVRLFRTMTRLGEDAGGLVDATLYGEHFEDFFDVQEEMRRRERTKYRMFDKDGKFLWPQFESPVNWLRNAVGMGGGAVSPDPEGNNNRGRDDDEEAMASSRPEMVRGGRDGNMMNRKGAPRGSVGGPVSIAATLAIGKQNKKDARRAIRVKDYMDTRTRDFFTRKRAEATEDLLRMGAMPSIEQRSLRMLFSLHMDLVDRRSQLISEMKMKRDNNASWELTKSAWTFAFIVVGGCLTSVAALGFYIKNAQQTFWMYTVFSGLVIELTCIKPFQIVLTHVGLPALAATQIARARTFIIDNLKNFIPQTNTTDKKNNNRGGAKRGAQREVKRRNTVSTGQKLNVVPYLYVSYRLARGFETMRTSQAIRGINTSISQLWLPENKALTLMSIPEQLLTWFVHQGVIVQDWIISWFTSVISVFLVLVVVQLYTWHPAIIPVGMLGYIALYIIFVMYNYTRTKKTEERDGRLIQNNNKILAIVPEPTPSQKVGSRKYAGTPKDGEMVSHDLFLRDEVEVFDVVDHDVKTSLSAQHAKRAVSGFSRQLTKNRKSDSGGGGVMKDVQAFVKKATESEDVTRDFKEFSMNTSDIKSYMFQGGGHYGVNAENAASHHLFMRDNMRREHEERSEQLYQNAVQNISKGKPAQRAMRLMYQSAMAALDAGKEGVARKRLGLAGGQAYNEAYSKQVQSTNVQAAGGSHSSVISDDDSAADTSATAAAAVQEKKEPSRFDANVVKPAFLSPLGLQGPRNMASQRQTGGNIISSTGLTANTLKMFQQKRGIAGSNGGGGDKDTKKEEKKEGNEVSNAASPVSITARLSMRMGLSPTSAAAAADSRGEDGDIDDGTSAAGSDVGDMLNMGTGNTGGRRRRVRHRNGTGSSIGGMTSGSEASDTDGTMSASGSPVMGGPAGSPFGFKPLPDIARPIAEVDTEGGSDASGERSNDNGDDDRNPLSGYSSSVAVRKVVRRPAPSELTPAKSSRDFTSPAASLSKYSGNVKHQRDMFANAMKRLDTDRPKPTGGFSSDPAVAIKARAEARLQAKPLASNTPLRAKIGTTNGAGYERDDDGVAAGGGDTAKTDTNSTDANTTTGTSNVATAGQGAGELQAKSHTASSFAAYLASKKASQKTNSIGRRRVRRTHGGDTTSGSEAEVSSPRK